jgi:hypothetical protein
MAYAIAVLVVAS